MKGLNVPTIMIPKTEIDIQKWTVVACDQYTSELDYWQKVKTLTENSPTTLNLIYPEVYLNESEDEANSRIKSINETMQKYIDDNVFTEFKGFVLVDRKTSHAESRKGLVVALDLEEYDYNKGSQTLIRATEKTIVDRLPPRIKIRENAPIELPHIMVLIDDPEKTVIEPLFNKELETLYDFDLMQNSGHIKGYKLDNPEIIKEIEKKLDVLADEAKFQEKYPGKGVLLFAMGDGNHSLATAKAIWEQKKSAGASMEDSARFALVELVNVHDEGLTFEPIHRVIFKLDINDMFEKAKEDGFIVKYFDTEEQLKAFETQGHAIKFVTKDAIGLLIQENPTHNIEVGTLQIFLDKYLEGKDAELDYIHGDDVVADLGSKENNIGFYLPPMDKNELFKTVILNEALPRKTFSMGEADEKRFYLECRRIK